MTIQLTKHTGEYETLTRKVTDEEGNIIDEPYESEILEIIRETEVSDDIKEKILRSERLMAQSKEQDTGFRYSVKIVN